MTLAQAVLSTLRYSDCFDFPLTLTELHSRLIGHRVDRDELILTLDKLVAKRTVVKNGRYFHLPDRSSVVSLRSVRAVESLPRLEQARSYISRLKKVPGVLAIYLTGSLAVKNSRRDDDIDLMVITEDGSLWITRFLLTLYSTLLGIRRTPDGRDIAGKLCLNLYLCPAGFTLPETKRNLYTAYELIQAVPLWDPQGTQAALLSGNSWLSSYLPNFRLPAGRFIPRRPPVLLPVLEKLAYHLQLLYMKKRLTREFVTPVSAFFHPSDPGGDVLGKL